MSITRCVYHGWKFDTEGNCLEMANVPSHQDFRHKVYAKSYKTEERNGLIWVYMGEREETPELPQFEAVLSPEEEQTITCVDGSRRLKVTSIPLTLVFCIWELASSSNTWKMTTTRI